jgi:hypothetical protein
LSIQFLEQSLALLEKRRPPQRTVLESLVKLFNLAQCLLHFVQCCAHAEVVLPTPKEPYPNQL